MSKPWGATLPPRDDWRPHCIVDGGGYHGFKTKGQIVMRRAAGCSVGFRRGLLALALTLLTAAPSISAWGASGPEEQPLRELLAPEFQLPAVWTGDLDGMVERRVVRVLTTFSKTIYFFDGLTQHGTAYEMLQAFESFLNEELNTPEALPVRLQIIPVDRDTLLPALAEGHGDIATANLTITTERAEIVDFSDPFSNEAREIVITGSAGPELASLDDLAGQTLHLRRSSSYWTSVAELNQQFAARGLPPIELVPVDPYLEDEDLIEMVAAGALPWLVVDEHKAAFWVDIIPGLTMRGDLVLREGGEIAAALRKGTPKLLELVNRFLSTVKQGTEYGNIVTKRYYADNQWMRNPAASEDFERFQTAADLFRRYGEQYGFDWLMLAAQGYQESRIDQSVRSPAGAVGVMQLLPETAADPNIGIEDISDIENNIHAGAKYLRFLIDHYLADEPIDDFNRTLFAFAAYNAGPGNLRKIRAEAAQMGLDPNVWFGNAEIATAELIGRETTAYVANIAKYYYAYRLIQQAEAAKATADAPG